jgi:hypothetical protein
VNNSAARFSTDYYITDTIRYIASTHLCLSFRICRSLRYFLAKDYLASNTQDAYSVYRHTHFLHTVTLNSIRWKETTIVHPEREMQCTHIQCNYAYIINKWGNKTLPHSLACVEPRCVPHFNHTGGPTTKQRASDSARRTNPRLPHTATGKVNQQNGKPNAYMAAAQHQPKTRSSGSGLVTPSGQLGRNM